MSLRKHVAALALIGGLLGAVVHYTVSVSAPPDHFGDGVMVAGLLGLALLTAHHTSYSNTDGTHSFSYRGDMPLGVLLCFCVTTAGASLAVAETTTNLVVSVVLTALVTTAILPIGVGIGCGILLVRALSRLNASDSSSSGN